ncbi:MAG: hypothetical protein F4X98_11760 [Gammaproteobacteria bacterium]|nr:hypothetical protein [Gammaproteobacteria bacterium]
MSKMWTYAAVLPLLVLTTPAEAQDPDSRLAERIERMQVVLDELSGKPPSAHPGPLRDVTEMEVRTFKLVHLDARAANRIIQPYVVAPGTISGTSGALTVREVPDVLDRIGDALKAVDVPPPTPQFRFQFVKANGSERTDPRIADIEDVLRRALRFDGYALAGEAIASGTEFTIRVATGGTAEYEIHAHYYGHTISELDVELTRHQPASGGAFATEVDLLATKIGIRPGQTLILGSTADSGETLLIVVRMVEG